MSDAPSPQPQLYRALDEVARLRAENERLREALGDLLDSRGGTTNHRPVHYDGRLRICDACSWGWPCPTEVARAALAPPPSETEETAE